MSSNKFDTTTKLWGGRLMYPLIIGAGLAAGIWLIPFLITFVTGVLQLLVTALAAGGILWLFGSKAGRALVNQTYLQIIRAAVHYVFDAGVLIKDHVRYLKTRQKDYEINVKKVHQRMVNLKEMVDGYSEKWSTQVSKVKHYKYLANATSDAEEKRGYVIELNNAAAMARQYEDQAKSFEKVYQQLKSMHARMEMIGTHLKPLVKQWEAKYDLMIERQKAMADAMKAVKAGQVVLDDDTDFMAEFAVEKIEEQIIQQSAAIDQYIDVASETVKDGMFKDSNYAKNLIAQLDSNDAENILTSFLSDAGSEYVKKDQQFNKSIEFNFDF